eukprot:2338813-Pyramimonas_sp.AAC.1
MSPFHLRRDPEVICLGLLELSFSTTHVLDECLLALSRCLEKSSTACSPKLVSLTFSYHQIHAA